MNEFHGIGIHDNWGVLGYKVPFCVSCYSHLPDEFYGIFKKIVFFHFLKIGGQLHYIILFHESWWHWQDLLLHVSKLIAFLVCICRWLHIKINFIFANTIGIILIEKIITCSMPKDLVPSLMLPSSFHVCSTFSTCEARRSYLNNSWRTKEKEICKLMWHE